MKHSLFFMLMLATVAFSCNEQQQTASTDNKDTSKMIENKIMIPASSCYAFNSATDSVYLKVEVFTHVVTGTLSYKLREKDSNNGDIEGHIHGDTLLADYAFLSEGIRSVRQVAFLLSDSAALEGYGDMKEDNKRMIFTNTGKLNFGNGIQLKRIPCN
jgi:hypothetical protein